MCVFFFFLLFLFVCLFVCFCPLRHHCHYHRCRRCCRFTSSHSRFEPPTSPCRQRHHRVQRVPGDDGPQVPHLRGGGDHRRLQDLRQERGRLHQRPGTAAGDDQPGRAPHREGAGGHDEGGGHRWGRPHQLQWSVNLRRVPAILRVEAKVRFSLSAVSLFPHSIKFKTASSTTMISN